MIDRGRMGLRSPKPAERAPANVQAGRNQNRKSSANSVVPRPSEKFKDELGPGEGSRHRKTAPFDQSASSAPCPRGSLRTSQLKPTRIPRRASRIRPRPSLAPGCPPVRTRTDHGHLQPTDALGEVGSAAENPHTRPTLGLLLSCICQHGGVSSDGGFFGALARECLLGREPRAEVPAGTGKLARPTSANEGSGGTLLHPSDGTKSTRIRSGGGGSPRKGLEGVGGRRLSRTEGPTQSLAAPEF